MKSRRLTCETLEDRRLMAVSSVKLTGGVLKITADSRGSDVHVYSSGTKIVVKDNAPGGFYLTTPTWSYAKSAVHKIEFHGGRGNDVFDNDAYVPVVAWGNDGHDQLNGGNAADILYGGDGNDKLWGIGGNDRLYGGNDNDALYGGDGHDSLFGGGEYSVDQLWGGSGRDRFLTQPTDVIRDGSGIYSRTGEDAQLRFVDRGASWSNREIEVVDQAFAQLFNARGDNRLLKETQGNAPLTFYQDNLTDAAGTNTVFTYTRGCWTEGPWYRPRTVCDYRTRFDHREIAIDEWNESSAAENRSVVSTVIHEIGHNYDNDGVNDATWNNFKKISGWVQNPSKTSGLFKGADFNTGTGKNQGWHRATNKSTHFAEGYGGVNPMEDWATVWEWYFANGRSTYASDAKLTAKLRLVDHMVRLA